MGGSPVRSYSTAARLIGIAARDRQAILFYLFYLISAASDQHRPTNIWAHVRALLSSCFHQGADSTCISSWTRPQIGKVSTPTANVAQSIERTSESGKLELLVALLHNEQQTEQTGGPKMPLTVVFVERKTRCDEVAEALNREEVKAVPLHGGLSQVRIFEFEFEGGAAAWWCCCMACHR